MSKFVGNCIVAAKPVQKLMRENFSRYFGAFVLENALEMNVLVIEIRCPIALLQRNCVPLPYG